MQDNDSQYQSLSYKVFKDVVSPLVSKKNRICYGSSLGGYCALYYAGAINADVIAAAPKNSAHPDFVELDNVKRFPKGLFKHSSLGENQLTHGRICVFYDPYNLSDVTFFRKYVRPYYPGVTLIEVPHAGHEVLHYLRETNQLKQFVVSYADGDLMDIDLTINAPCLELGLAKHWSIIGDGEKASLFASSVLNRDNVKNRNKKEVLRILKKFS